MKRPPTITPEQYEAKRRRKYLRAFPNGPEGRDREAQRVREVMESMTYCSRCKSRTHMTLAEFQDHDQLMHAETYQEMLPKEGAESDRPGTPPAPDEQRRRGVQLPVEDDSD